MNIDDVIEKELSKVMELNNAIELSHSGNPMCALGDREIIRCEKKAKRHKQIADWLIELKAYKEIGTVDELTNLTLDIEKAYEKGRIDEQRKIIDIIDESDDACNAVYNVSVYLVDEIFNRG